MKRFLAAACVSLMLVSGGAFAVPSATQIESAMQQGNWQQADAGLAEVLQAHPNNARAHYLYAQVLDREGRYADALTHIQQAKTLDPQVRFTDASRFAQTEARIRRDAQRAGATTTNRAANPFAQQAAPAAQVQQATMMQPVTPKRQGVSMGMIIGLVVLFVAIAFVLRWTLKRARSNEDSRADGDRREQLKRATELLNAVRSLKLDVRLSTVPGHEALEREVEGLETQLRQLVETLSNSPNPVPPYQLDDLARQVDSVKARSEGRPDPNATGAAAYGPAPLGSGDSVYAREADQRFGQQQ
ncbi:MAG TPA: tetratricopeptide repeat protein, partial [Paraburkholderia sp.]|nr:tetratricopeptide repeat protein [Paraburkholderia sp.]